MRKIIITEFLSLDGVMQDPAWTEPYWSDAISQYKHDELFECDALLLGKTTYDGFATAWPNQTDEDGFADRMNSLPKYVTSTTMAIGNWQNTIVIQGDVMTEITKLKQTSGGNILVFGSSDLIQTLLQHALIDEIRLLVYPVILGLGKKLFQAESQLSLKLLHTQTFDTGVVALHYQPIK